MKTPLYKLGCLPSPHDPRTLRLESFLADTLPPIKPSVNWSKKARPLGMMLNDRMGDCTCAAAGHGIQIWTANESTQIILPDADILAAYRAVSGYDPKTGANDNGATLLSVLKLWRSKGVGGRKCSAYVSINPRNRDHIKLAIDLFGGVYFAVGLPLASQGKSSWDTPANLRGRNAPGSWGGHAVWSGRYSATTCPVVSWGSEIPMSWGYWDAYGLEAWAVLSPDWIADGTSPSGFDLPALQRSLAAL